MPPIDLDNAFCVATFVDRAEQPSLERLLEGRDGMSEALAAGTAILQQRSRALAPLAAALHAAERGGTLEQPVRVLAGHCLHMRANRVLRPAARAQGDLLYHFRERLYELRIGVTFKLTLRQSEILARG